MNTALQSTQSKSQGLALRDGLLYLLVGGGIGAAVALLFAPKSGADLRNDISDLSRKGLEETRGLAAQLKDKSAGIYNAVKEKSDSVFDLASVKFSRAQNQLDDSLATAGDKVNNAIEEVDRLA